MTKTATEPSAGIQLCLFPGLAVGEGVKRAPRRRGPCRAQALAFTPEFQYLLVLPERLDPPAAVDCDDEEDDDLVKSPIVHRMVAAAQCAALKVKAPCSIFDVGALSAFNWGAGRREDQSFNAHKRIEREDGVTRVIHQHHTETEEWQEQERARRARQKPPRPPKQKFSMKNSRTWAK